MNVWINFLWWLTCQFVRLLVKFAVSPSITNKKKKGSQPFEADERSS